MSNELHDEFQMMKNGWMENVEINYLEYRIIRKSTMVDWIVNQKRKQEKNKELPSQIFIMISFCVAAPVLPFPDQKAFKFASHTNTHTNVYDWIYSFTD